MNIGKHIIIGFEGTWPDDALLSFIKEEGIGGVILFARNLESLEQIRDLIRRLREARPDPFLISVDHEGGRVFRLPEPFTPVPPARVFGAYYERSQDIAEIEEITVMIARELMSVGFNLNFAPVLDVDTCPDNPIIGDRAFHSDPEVVASLGLAMIRGFGSAGLLCCGKHFPGHGGTREDSHKTLPVVDVTRRSMEERELIPFQHAIRAGVPALMSAHVKYPQIDPDHCATVSTVINKSLLRDTLGYRGVLFSDDLLMAGIRQGTTVPGAAARAIEAGCDVLLICQGFEEQQATVEHLKREVEKAPFALQLEIAADRIDRLLTHLPAPGSELPSVASEELRRRLVTLAG